MFNNKLFIHIADHNNIVLKILRMAETEDSLPELDSSTEDNTPTVSLSKKRKRSRVQYTLSESFKNEDAAKEFLRKEDCWGRKIRSNTEDGTKIYYRCNRVKARGEQCASSLYLLLESTTGQIKMFRSVLDHNCDAIQSKAGPSIHENVKKNIEELRDQNQKPLDIIDHLTMVSHD